MQLRNNFRFRGNAYRGSKLIGIFVNNFSTGLSILKKEKEIPTTIHFARQNFVIILIISNSFYANEFAFCRVSSKDSIMQLFVKIH